MGTAFAITMIMAIVITWQTKYADLEPEVNRSRCLYFSAMHVYDKEKDGNNNWSNPSAAFMKECVQPVPEVEYCTAFSPAGLSLASLTDGNNRVKVDAMRTDPDFWKVFSMQFLAGRGFSEADRAGESKAVVVCASVARKLYGSTDVVGQEFLLNRELARIIKQMGKTGAFRSYRYGVEEPWFFYHLGENMIKAEFADNWSQIVFRVKPAADGPDYREKFLREIAPKLDTDNAFVADAAPYTEQQLQFEVMNGDTDKVNSQAVVVLFLLVNVFLGLIGTFWFRTRRRRSEIALRMAMGSTRGGVFRLLIGEGLLLLALVTLPAIVVCYNVGMAEFTIGRTSLISTWPIEWSVIRFLAGSLGAWLLIALMVVIGIWFPARQAMKIEPAEALHEE